jgi:hypothetical protein
MDFSAVLRPLLESPTVKAGVGIGDDIKQLRELFAFQPAAIVDLGALARRSGVERSGVRALAAMFLGLRIPKGTKTSNWAAPRLSRADRVRGDRRVGLPRALSAVRDAWNKVEIHRRGAFAHFLAPPARRSARKREVLRCIPR